MRFNSEAVTHIIKGYVPQYKVDSSVGTQMTYILPLESSGSFPHMFSHLEDNKVELGIASLDLQCTTIEEVFLR